MQTPWGAQTFVTGQFLRTEGGVTGVLKRAKGKLVADAAAQIDDASGWRQLEFPKEVGDWLGVAAQFVKIGQQLRQERQQLGRCFEHRFAPGLPLYLVLRRGANAMHLSEREGDARPNTLVYLHVDDIEAIAREFGAPIEDQPWAREVVLVDCDGNRWRIGQRDRG